jgi:hypothetical protein
MQHERARHIINAEVLSIYVDDSIAEAMCLSSAIPCIIFRWSMEHR